MMGTPPGVVGRWLMDRLAVGPQQQMPKRPAVRRTMAVKYQTRGRYAVRTRNLAIVVLLLGGYSSSEAPAGPPKPHVSVANPIVREVIDWDDYVGRFEAVQDVTVMPRVSGTITTIMFRNGRDVKAGDALFIIDPRPFRAVYDQAVADLSRARSTQTNASTGSAR